MKTSPDIVDIQSLQRRSAGDATPRPVPRRFLSIWFRCCHAYGRLYRNAAGTSYNGRCPRCGTRAQALIRPDGSTRRCFQTID